MSDERLVEDTLFLACTRPAMLLGVTLPVSSKALLIFQGDERPAWTSTDLLKLGALLAPAYAALMVATYYLFWSHVGLAL